MTAVLETSSSASSTLEKIVAAEEFVGEGVDKWQEIVARRVDNTMVKITKRERIEAPGIPVKWVTAEDIT